MYQYVLAPSVSTKVALNMALPEPQIESPVVVAICGLFKIIEAVAEVVTPQKSVTVTVYVVVDDGDTEVVAVVAPVDHEYVYGTVPLLGVAVTLLDCPEHKLKYCAAATTDTATLLILIVVAFELLAVIDSPAIVLSVVAKVYEPFAEVLMVGVQTMLKVSFEASIPVLATPVTVADITPDTITVTLTESVARLIGVDPVFLIVTITGSDTPWQDPLAVGLIASKATSIGGSVNSSAPISGDNEPVRASQSISSVTEAKTVAVPFNGKLLAE